MKQIFLFSTLIITGIFFSGCHVYYKGFIINKTKDTLTITTKPSLLIYQKDSAYYKLVNMNMETRDSVFKCLIFPGDSLLFNGGPSFSSSISLIDYLKIKRNNRDSVLMLSRKAIRKRTESLHKFFNHLVLGIKVTDEFMIKERQHTPAKDSLL